MVQVLRQRHGKRYEPNKYASERIAVPAATAWRLAREADSVEAYTKFIEVWPDTHSQLRTLRSDQLLLHFWRSYAGERIKELKYPPYLRKTISGLSWIVYAASGLFIASFYFMWALH